MNLLDSVFSWFTAATIRGSLLVLAVLAIHAVMRRALPAQWRYALWLPVLLVLLAPQVPQSRWSADNYIAPSLTEWVRSLTARSQPGRQQVAAPEQAPRELGRELPEQRADLLPIETAPVQPPISGWRRIAAIGWAAGAAGLLVFALLAYARTWRRIVRGAASPDPALQMLLAEAATACGLRHTPRLLLSSAVASPAVTGFLRPTVLLPASFSTAFTREEARLILLHELMHVKRFDLPVNWLLCLAQALHWCNPLLWLAIRRMRADREAACDAQVLAITRENGRAEYGHALLKLEGTLLPSRLNLGFIGIFERMGAMHSRLQAIAAYRKVHPAWAAPGMALLIAIALAGGTRAQEAKTQERPIGEAAPAVPEEAGRALVLQKLRTIVIPRLEFREATLQEALNFLHAKSRELDTAEAEPSRRGVKFSLALDEPGGGAPLNPRDARITVALKNIPLVEAVKYVTALTNLAFRVTADGVIVLRTDAKVPLVTREWKISPKAGVKPGDNAREIWERSIPFPEGADATYSADGTRLVVTNTAENLDRVDELLNDVWRAAADALRHKLNSIIIPRLEFRDATLREAVDFLSRKSFELDPESDPANRGVSIVVKLDATSSAPPANGISAVPTIPGLDPVPGKASGAPGAAALDPNEARITLSLKEIPFLEALRYVTSLANLDFRIEPYAVAIVPRRTSDGVLVTKEWPLNEAAASALGISADAAAKEALIARSVTFPGGAAAMWNPLSRKLVVRNTSENLDRIDSIIAALPRDSAPAGSEANRSALETR